MDSSIPFYESSNIVPWTYSSPYNPIFVHMYYIVEGVGAFSTFGLEENRDLDVTVFSTDPKYISHMEQQFEILLKYSDLMAKKLGSGDFLRFIHTYCEHWDEGNILSISKYPTLVSLTPKLLKETMNRFEMETMGELFLATKEKLIENLNEYTFTEIIEETSFDPENTDPFPMTPDSKRYLSVEQQIERFEELKRLMLTYENYEVYTYPVDDDIKSVHINPNSGVLLEVKNKKKVGYLIEDERIIHMLSYYFRNRFVLPNAISKQDMLEKIDKKIESLEKRLNSDKKK
ncbi:hypothetical protein LQU94_04890 [Peptoniphilus sp. KCTC 25270]|uniref:hypothetical protein n=1 Tax=Peptoniphilus sp. KCTC 25270 TaxID=2897414 RepID=UPI001E33E66C|nr:hypothetical protein [Peptoniphilus sp. KCTC 25270]MCD1147444.1 hypothetical protein [Peptoniphilus sp. KCTC 25270]